MAIWMKEVRKIINELSLNSFTIEVMNTLNKYPKANIESKAEMLEINGNVWFSVVLLYEREEE